MKYLQQFVTTSLNVGGGIDASQTTGIVLQSLNNIDATKPSVACISWADPLSTSVAEWVTYTSINSTTNELQGVTRGAEGYSAKTHSNGATVAFPLSKAHVNEVNDSVDTGWVIVNETFTYASATTITVASGAASRFQKGDKLKLTNNSVKYFYIVGVADTVLTVTGGSDYALADAAITSPYLSRVENPFGFPTWFAYTSTIGASGSMTIADPVLNTCKFHIAGKTLTLAIDSSFTTGGSASNTATFTLPVAPDDTGARYATGARIIYDSGSNGGFVYLSTVANVRSYSGANFTLATTRQAAFVITYGY